MGRLSSKRPRSPPVDTLPLANKDNQRRGSLLDTWWRLEKNSNLQSLVICEANDPSHHFQTAKEASVTRQRVQQVWGALGESDIAPCSASGLRLGIDVETDSTGVAWLLNTASHPGLERSSRACYGHDADDALQVSLCDADLRGRLSELKEVFTEIPSPVFKRVRSECNAAEALDNGPFLNRSAMKLANIDAIMRLSGLQPLSLSGDPVQMAGEAMRRATTEDSGASGSYSPAWQREPRDEHTQGEARQRDAEQGGPKPQLPLLFADLCGGPGGFSEYLLRKRRELGFSSRGWGISLMNISSSSGGSSGAALDINVGRDGGNARSSCQTGARGEGVMSVTFFGDQSATRVDRVQPTKDPCAWRLDRLALWCDVMIKRRKRSQFLEASDESSASERAPNRAPAEIVEAHGNVGNGGVKTGNSGYSGSGREARCPVGHLGDHWSGCRPLGREGRENDAKFTTSNSSYPEIIRADVAGNDAERGARSSLEMVIDYGPNGTGDLLDEANMVGFVESVLASTGGRRLDVVVADGGFAAARDAREQERLILPLLNAEALVALRLLAEGGSFVCKMFEAWTTPTASLVYLLHRNFQRISIVKPVTSRPASGERYVICIGLLRQTPENHGLIEHLHSTVAPTWKQEATCSVTPSSSDACRGGSGVLDVESEMKNDKAFTSFLRLVNDRLATVQADACSRIIEASSSKWGRAWAFRGGKEKDTAGRDGSGAVEGELVEDEAGGDSLARRCFMQAWELNGL